MEKKVTLGPSRPQVRGLRCGRQRAWRHERREVGLRQPGNQARHLRSRPGQSLSEGHHQRHSPRRLRRLASRAPSHRASTAPGRRAPDTTAVAPAATRSADARRRMILAWVLAAPVIALMIVEMLRGHGEADGAPRRHVPRRHGDRCPYRCALRCPSSSMRAPGVYRSAWLSAIHGYPNMDVLIALGTLSSLATGVMKLAGMQIDSYAAVAAMIMAIHLTGRYLEAQARGRASDAVQRLLKLAAKTAKADTRGREGSPYRRPESRAISSS